MKSWNMSNLSIRQRLPLFICILLLSIILVFGWISYVGVKRAALQIGQDRLITLTDQLSLMFSNGMATSSTAIHAATDKNAIKKFLLSGGKDSTREALEILNGLIKDSIYVKAELLNVHRIQILNADKGAIYIDANPDSLLLAASGVHPDSIRVGKLYAVKDSVYYPIIVPIID